jgi:hypothetical protein
MFQENATENLRWKPVRPLTFSGYGKVCEEDGIPIAVLRCPKWRFVAADRQTDRRQCDKSVRVCVALCVSVYRPVTRGFAKR